jgi:hypothetical protein
LISRQANSAAMSALSVHDAFVYPKIIAAFGTPSSMTLL